MYDPALGRIVQQLFQRTLPPPPEPLALSLRAVQALIHQCVRFVQALVARSSLVHLRRGTAALDDLVKSVSGALLRKGVGMEYSGGRAGLVPDFGLRWQMRGGRYPGGIAYCGHCMRLCIWQTDCGGVFVGVCLCADRL